MYYITEDKSSYKKYNVIFDKNLLEKYIIEVDTNTTIVKRCFSSVKNKEDFYTDETMSDVIIKEDGNDIYISYNKEFKSKLYYIIKGILNNDEMSIYELLDLYNEYKDIDKNLSEHEKIEYQYILKVLRLIKFDMVTKVNVNSEDGMNELLDGVNYSRIKK